MDCQRNKSEEGKFFEKEKGGFNLLELLQKNSAKAVLWGRVAGGKSSHSLLFKYCQLLQYLVGDMQVALPGWRVRNLSSANKNVVSTQAETFRVCIFVIGERGREERKPAPKTSYREVYLLYFKSIFCRPMLGPLRGLQNDALSTHSIEPRADFGLTSTRVDFPAAALKPLQLPVVLVHFRREPQHKEVLFPGPCKSAVPMANKLILELSSLKTVVDLAVLGLRLDSILRVFSNLNNSMFLCKSVPVSVFWVNVLLKTLSASDTVCCGLLAEFWILEAFSSPSFPHHNNSFCSSYRSNNKCSINVCEIKAILVPMSLQNSLRTQPDGEVIYPRNDDLKFGHLV